MPSWDQADYLTGSLNYWKALQHPQWFSGEWWESFWQLSSKVPPLTYIATAIVQNLFGTGPDSATLVNLLFSAILLASVYGLGVQLFSVQIGLWAAGLCQLLPGLYRYRLDFLLDFPLTAVVTLSFYCLTAWRSSRNTLRLTSPLKREGSPISPPSLLGDGVESLGQPLPRSSGSSRTAEAQRTQRREWFWAAAFGLSLGLALMVKQTALFFLLAPVLWVGAGVIRHRAWGRLAQLVFSLLLSVLVFGPWYRANWLLMLTSGKRATVDSAIAEGDPALNTLEAWTYYWKILPYHVSWPLLLVPIVGLLIYWGRAALSNQKAQVGNENKSKIGWLAIFWVGSYLLCSLNINKDSRYVLPYLPVVALFLAYGLTRWVGRWNYIRWGTISLAVLLMFLNWFPEEGTIWKNFTQALSPYAQHPVYLEKELPHPQVIREIIQTEPYLRSTLGVLPSTANINQHNFNYYGALQNFQVYGRQVGTRKKQVAQDARSLSWFLTKTGKQGSVPDAQATIVQTVEQGSDFQLHKTWNLSENSSLKLYHQKSPPVQVQPLSEPQNKVKLVNVKVPEIAPPGVPVPITYEWTGSWEQLQSGIVLLTWRSEENTENPKSQWLHDRAIGMGNLYPEILPDKLLAKGFRVIEQTAMLPKADTSAGIYTLEATYLNRKTGETYPIQVPPVTLKIDAAAATPAPELDLGTQLRTLAATLPQGTAALEQIFAETGRINQYDPIQDYLVQAQLALEYRLQREPNRDLAYALALSRVLKRQAKDAIASLERVVRLDSENPYAYAYLAFVHLYEWHPKKAQNVLKPAVALNPNLLEIKALSGVAALMQGDFLKAWHIVQEIRK
ncbi:phospholipid carrier-dependent glycosyltransferase [Trichocoleus sp. FACHB-90]|nr:phospholipid carrier-dependent glycosyltransferase [Trichocoleus sp. FACHB-90]